MTFTYAALVEFVKSLPPPPQQMTVVMSDNTFDKIRMILARNRWREFYRTARVLGDRELAFQRVGLQREGF